MSTEKAKYVREKIELICPCCQKSYLKDFSEFTRNVKLNRPSYCSLSCSRITLNKSKQLHPLQIYFRHTCKNNRNHEVTITLQDLINQWDKQQGKCSYTQVDLKLKTRNSSIRKEKDWYLYASLDRIDSDKGYTKDNIEFVSLGINYMKNTCKKSEVIEFLNIICKNLTTSLSST
jgi:hypothetical protein